MMMKLCDLNTAKTLQELGYDGECPRWYSREGKLKTTHLVDDDISAPRLDDAAYFIRDKHGLNIRISYCQATEDWFYDILNIKTDEYYDEIDTYYADYNDALDAAVTKAIETIKNKKQ